MTTNATTTGAPAVDVLAIDDAGAGDPARVGAKAAGLHRLRAAGFDVPDAAVVTVGVATTWPDGDPPAELRTAVIAWCDTLGPRLAVRSSATWEDAATSAHAGATATVLDVEGPDAVLAAIRHCLDASAQAQRIRGEHGDIAIVLQRLVDADFAGVAFTADPVSGERDVIRLAATKGLGEALVQGEVVGSDVTVRAGGGPIEGDLGDLPETTARAVADIARRVEAAFGAPQDIEWAVRDDEVHLLQARPITVLPTEPAYPEGNNWQKDTAHYPEPLTPFGWSLMHDCLAEVQGVFDEMGTMIRGLEERLVGGEIYSRAIPAFGSPDSAGSPPPAAVLGVLSRIVPPIRKRVKAATAAIDEGKAQRWAREWHEHDRADMIRRHAELAAVDLTALDDAGLLAHLERCRAFNRLGHRIHFRLMMPLFQALHALHVVVDDALGWDDSKLFAMLVGHSPATRAADEALSQIRARVRATPGARDALERSPGQPVAALADVDPDLGAALAAWMTEHGWAMVNYDAGVPTLAERPTVITRLVLSEPDPVDFAAAERVADEARAALPADRRAEFEQRLAAARAIYPVREDNMIIVGDRPLALTRRAMLEAARRLVAAGALASVTDAPYLMVDELCDALAGRTTDGLTELAARRRNEEAWARANPGPAYLGEQGAMPDISRTPAGLRAVNEPILWALGHEYPPPVDLPDDADALVAGVPASPGVAEGPVRIIRSHRELDRFCDGEILVCQVTSPAWAPMFGMAKAVVADGGGVLSHAAIAAREHGIPAVLGTGDGTTTLTDGQWVRVDGVRGIVTAVDR